MNRNIDPTIGQPPYQLRYNWQGVEWHPVGPAWPDLATALRVRDWLRMELGGMFEFQLFYNGGEW